VAWVPAYDQFRTFAVDRVERLSVTEETFKKTRDLPADLFGASLGVFSGEAEKIELEFESRVAPYVRGRVWHDSQEMAPRPDGSLRMRLHVSNDWALKTWVLGFGAAVRVISPASLRDEIRDECARASKQYASQTG
jgi:predicted DNA-binding transcriptional regulator YafY